MAPSTPIFQEGRNRILPHAAVIFASARILCVAVSGLDSPIHKKTLLQFTFANYQFFPHSSSMARPAFMFTIIRQGWSDIYKYKSFAQYFSG